MINIGFIALSLYVILVISTILTIIIGKGDPVKALAWIVVVTLIPVLGFFLYIMFGQNYRKKKIFNRKEVYDALQFGNRIEKQLYEINSPMLCTADDIVQNRDTITLLLNNSKSLLSVKNELTILNNGSETFPAIIKALKNAKSFIHVEYYIIMHDSVGKEFADVLCEKAREGVKVRLIYDAVGSWGLNRLYIRKLKKAGVQTCCFMPVAFPWFTSKINYRNHRKIIVIDGETAFTGGLNMAERYLYGSKKLGFWRDVHVKIRGEAVASLQTIFALDWYFESKEILSDNKLYYPKSAVQKDTLVQIVASGPDSDWSSIMQGYFSAITKAKDHIYISTPYFLPNGALMTALKVAALGGTDVRLMIPHRSDSRMMYWASRSYVGELLDAGIKVYLYDGFNHSKILMIDGTFSSIGTANMDIRSFENNFEVTAMIYDREKTMELEKDFLYDLEGSKRITREYWENRPHKYNIYEGFSRLFSPLL